MGNKGRLKGLIVAACATAAVLAIASSTGAAPGTDASVGVYDQCANGQPPSTATDCPEHWINGILNANNSHYAEDDVTPQRVVLDLPQGGPTTGRTVEISYMTRKGGVHAYDSLATWNHTQTTADRCADINASDCVPDPATTFPIPLDPTVVADNNGGGSPTSGHQLGGQVFTMYGGTITDVSAYTHDDAAGTGDSFAHVTLTYSVPSLADDAKVMLLFGGHIAPSLGPRGWGVGVGAGSISGGPYHVRITAADGASVGNRDNQIMSGAILAPANLLIQKVAVGGDDTFGYTATGGISSPFSITTSGGNGSQSFTSIEPKAYTVTESAPPAGWDFTSLVCQDEDNGTTVAGATANIDLDPGETVTCTYTNTKRGKIIVEKQTNPDGDPQLFTFTPNYGSSFQLSDGQQNESALLVPGTYSVSETVPAGWSLASSTCDDGSSPSSIALAAGETVKCTFTNAKAAQVIVKKVMVGGTATFNFTGTPSGSIAVNNGTINASVTPGQYVSTEGALAGWDLTNVTCDDADSVGSVANRTATFNVAAGETVTCTFTNTKQGAIVIEKQTNPAGDPETFAFTGEIVASLADNGTADKAVAAGTYTVSESAEAGWNLTQISCDDGNSTGDTNTRTATFIVAAGETVKCTFTNVKQGRIIVEKQTDPAGDPETFAFTGEIVASLADNGTADKSVAPGTYTVTESAEAGWDLEQISCDDGNSTGSTGTRTATYIVAAGETVKCTFTNVKDANIIIEKQTNPANDPQSFVFTASYDVGGFSLSDNQQNDSGDLDPGTYSVAETVPQGWDLASALCDDQSNPSSIDLQAGETVTCVFTNVKDAKIVVEKQTNPANSAQSFHFDASYNAGGFNLIDNQQNDSGDLDPGQYSVSEDVPTGWDLTSAVCSDGSDPGAITLSAGEVVTCVFTNTKLGTIIVEKQTLPDGAAGSFTYTGDAAGSIGDNGQITVNELDPGTYTSTEAAAAGWDLTSIVCNDANSTGAVGTRTATFRLEAGETVKCTFTNSQLPTITAEGSLDVQKSADPTSVKEPGGLVTFSVTIRNTSNVVVIVDNVVDSVFGDLDDDGGNGCFDVPIVMPPGGSMNCTFQRQVTGPGGSTHINVVTVDGHDEGGRPLRDTDDARVDITPRLIDLVIVKTASSPTPLNGIVNYSMTVTNKGPDTATNVQLADPAPAGITYLTANPSQGTCNLTPSLITCSLGTIAPGQTVTIAVTGRATAVGTHTNVATVTGGGGRETNPADNVDDAVTVVPAPFVPPTKPKPKPQPEVCLTLTVSPKMIKADGKPDRVSVKVTAGKKRVKGTKVTIFGAGVRKSGRSNGNGMAVITVNPKKAGLITITALETNRKVCGPKRIGVVGVFLPPLTG